MFSFVVVVIVRFVSVVVVFFFKFVVMEVLENKSCRRGDIILVLSKILWLVGGVDRFFKVFRFVIFVFIFFIESILISGGMFFCCVRVILFWFVSFMCDKVFVIIRYKVLLWRDFENFIMWLCELENNYEFLILGDLCC